jgi:hypothetical protein
MKRYLLLLVFLHIVNGTGVQEISFAGEELPLTNQMALHYFLDISNDKLFSEPQLKVIRTRAGLYFPLIESILDKYQVPEDFKYLTVAESALLNVQSRKKAKGIWQIMPGTAKELGLAVTNVVDEREQVIKSTVAACKLLNKLHGRFKNWTLAAAAYNAGMGAIGKAMNQQGVNNFYQLRVNKETNDYIYKIIVYKMLLQGRITNDSVVDNVFDDTFRDWSVFAGSGDAGNFK